MRKVNPENKQSKVNKEEQKDHEKDLVINQLGDEIETLKQKLGEVEMQEVEAEKNRNILANLYENKVIDQDGNPL